MSYDAALVARRGIGADELARMGPAFGVLVRWAMIVEKLYAPVPEAMRVASMDPPGGMTGPDLVEFRANRGMARDIVREIRRTLFLEEPDESGPVVPGAADG